MAIINLRKYYYTCFFGVLAGVLAAAVHVIVGGLNWLYFLLEITESIRPYFIAS